MSVQRYLDQSASQCDKSLLLDFDGYRIQFNTNSAGLLSELVDYYQYFIVAPDDRDVSQIVEGLVLPASPRLADESEWRAQVLEPGKSKIKEQVLDLAKGSIIRKVATGIHLGYVGQRRICFGPLTTNPAQVINFINNVHLDSLLASNGQLFHAAGVCLGEVGLGLAGKSGKGKSTLALRLLQQGFDLVSNDRLVVRAEGKAPGMYGIAKYPRVNPGTLLHQPELASLISEVDMRRYRAMASEALWELEEKYDAFVEQAFDCKFRLASAMNLFVILDWDRQNGSPTRLDLVDPVRVPDLINTVVKSPGLLLPKANARIGTALQESYIDLLKGCDLYVLSGAVDFDKAARQIKSLVLGDTL